MIYPTINEPEYWPTDFNSAIPTSPTRKATSAFSYQTVFSQGTRRKAKVSHTFSGRLMLDGETLSCTAPKELWKQTLVRSTVVQLKRKVDNVTNKEIENDSKRDERQPQLSNNPRRSSVSNEDEINSLINQQPSINRTEIKSKIIVLYHPKSI